MIPNKSIKVLSITIAVILAVLLVLNALQDTDDCGSAAALAVLWVIAAFDPLCPYAIGWQIAAWMSFVSFTIILIASVCKCTPIKRILIFYSIMPVIYIVVTMILDAKLHPAEFPANIDKQIYKAIACLIVCRISCSYVRYYIGSAWHGVLALLLYLSMGTIVIITQEY